MSRTATADITILDLDMFATVHHDDAHDMLPPPEVPRQELVRRMTELGPSSAELARACHHVGRCS